jgi:hypothetical protein
MSYTGKRLKRKWVIKTLTVHGPLCLRDLFLQLEPRHRRNITTNELGNILAKYPEFIVEGHIFPYGDSKQIPLWNIVNEEE